MVPTNTISEENKSGSDYHAIKNYHRYVKLLKLGFLDKLFFIDKLFNKWETFLDYGCGDGTIAKMVAEIYPEKYVFGYEPNLELLDIAKNGGSLPSNILFTRQAPKTKLSVINLSSVLHEVYAYKTEEEISGFWDYIFETGFNTIIIRDMLYDSSSEADFVLQVPKLADKATDWCLNNNCFGELERFEALYGPLATPRNITQFILKYLYISSPNWNRELNENYLKLTFRELLKIIPKKYEVIYKESYVLPYLKHKWRQDFGMDVNIKTHGKLILQWKY